MILKFKKVSFARARLKLIDTNHQHVYIYEDGRSCERMSEKVKKVEELISEMEAWIS